MIFFHVHGGYSIRALTRHINQLSLALWVLTYTPHFDLQLSNWAQAKYAKKFNVCNKKKTTSKSSRFIHDGLQRQTKRTEQLKKFANTAKNLCFFCNELEIFYLQGETERGILPVSKAANKQGIFNEEI